MSAPANGEALFEVLKIALHASRGEDGQMDETSRRLLEKAAGLAQKNTDRLRVPVVSQSTGYNCGPAALLAAAKFFDAYTGSETDLAQILGTDPDNGTPPAAMLRGARKIGLLAEGIEGMTRMQLERKLIQGFPVIVCLQAWGTEQGYIDDESGHWVNVIGFDRENFYFEDPELEEGQFGYIPRLEFMERWHDRDGAGKPYYHFGLVVMGNR